jgi:hypothetical protein
VRSFIRFALDNDSFMRIMDHAHSRKVAKHLWSIRVAAAIQALVLRFKAQYSTLPDCVYVLGGNSQKCKGHAFQTAVGVPVCIPDTDDEVQYIHTLGGRYWSTLQVLGIENVGADVLQRGWTSGGQLWRMKDRELWGSGTSTANMQCD